MHERLLAYKSFAGQWHYRAERCIDKKPEIVVEVRKPEAVIAERNAVLSMNRYQWIRGMR